VDWARSQINKTRAALFREVNERDYGMDAIIELFDDGNPTGKLAIVQIKGTEKTIEPQKKKQDIACKITSANAYYALQDNIPVILLYVSIRKPEICYYATLQTVTEFARKKIDRQKTITVHIPQEQYFQESTAESVVDEIQHFFKEWQNSRDSLT
jgi:hypothetical protein